jgi:hypothetical protein
MPHQFLRAIRIRNFPLARAEAVKPSLPFENYSLGTRNRFRERLTKHAR